MSYRNPNRLIIDLISARIEAMITELRSYRETVNDMMWNKNHEEAYHEAVAEFTTAIEALSNLKNKLYMLLHIEKPMEKIR